MPNVAIDNPAGLVSKMSKVEILCKKYEQLDTFKYFLLTYNQIRVLVRVGEWVQPHPSILRKVLLHPWILIKT